MRTLTLPERFGNLEEVNDLVTGWESVKLAIRQECRDDRSIEKAKIAIEAGLNDAAINYFWNLTMYDLHSKIIVYGVDYFSAAINWEGNPLRTIEDLREVKDYQLISGTFALGIIPAEAHFFLQQCREIRNNFSTAHFPMGEIDKLETFNFIKNCIKYALTFDLPTPGLQIKDLIESITIERIDSDEEELKFKTIIESQSSKIHGPILHNLFSSFIKQDCDPKLKHNIRLLAPHLWDIVTEEVKSNIATRFVSLKDVKKKDASHEALEFLKIVNGVAYIPESFQEIIFQKQARSLIDAHNSWNNFHCEPVYAKDLCSLGKDVPLFAIHTYVKAIVLSFVGNEYGFSRGAQEYNIQMISDLSQIGVKTLFRILDTDIDVVRELNNMSPIKRLYEVMELIKDKTMSPEQKQMFDFITNTNSNPNKLQGHFKSLYWKLAKKP